MFVLFEGRRSSGFADSLNNKPLDQSLKPTDDIRPQMRSPHIGSCRLTNLPGWIFACQVVLGVAGLSTENSKEMCFARFGGRVRAVGSS